MTLWIMEVGFKIVYTFVMSCNGTTINKVVYTFVLSCNGITINKLVYTFVLSCNGTAISVFLEWSIVRAIWWDALPHSIADNADMNNTFPFGWIAECCKYYRVIYMNESSHKLALCLFTDIIYVRKQWTADFFQNSDFCSSVYLCAITWDHMNHPWLTFA